MICEWWEGYVGKVQNAGIFFPEESFLPIKSLNGFSLQTYRFHIPVPRGLIIMFHGMFSNSNEGSHIAKRFFEEGYAVLAIDQEGSGKSDGPHGDIATLQTFVHDSEKFILASKRLYPPDTPIFLMGISMGGTISVLLSLILPQILTGMVLFAPSLGVSPDLEPTLQKVVRCLNCCCGCVRITEFDQNLSTRNKDYHSYFRRNPYIYSGKMNVRTAVAMLDGLEEAESKLKLVKTPFIVFQGGADKAVSPEVTKKFVETCLSNDKELVIYEEMYHDIFHEPEIWEIIEKSIVWVNARAEDNRVRDHVV